MKSFKLFITLLFFCLTAFATESPMSSDSSEKKTETKRAKEYKTVVLGQTSCPKSGRPAAPSRQMVQCYYDGESIVIDFNFPEGECRVTVTDLYTGYPQSHTIDSSDNDIEIYVGDINESSIEISTEYGHNYSGILSAE